MPSQAPPSKVGSVAPPAPATDLVAVREALRAARGRAEVQLRGCGAPGCCIKVNEGSGPNGGCRCDDRALRAGARAGRSLRAHVLTLAGHVDALLQEVEALRASGRG